MCRIGPLRFRGPVMVLKTLNIASQNRVKANGSYKAQQVHHDPWLITIGIGDDNSSTVCIYFQDRPHGGVKLSIHQNDMLSVLYGLHSHMGTEFHFPRYLNYGVNICCFA